MKTVIIGGGRGCVSMLSFAGSPFMKELILEVIGVADINPLAPGLVLADKMGIATYTDVNSCLQTRNFELVIELTGNEYVFVEIQRHIDPGVRILDHKTALIIWDLHNTYEEQLWQLKELDKLEKELEEERNFLQSIFDNSSDVAVVMDKNLIIIRANNNFVEFAGKGHSEIIGQNCSDVLAGNEINCEQKELELIVEQIFKTGEPHTIVKKLSLPEESYWEITKTPIYNRSGEIEYILGSWHKITENITLQRKIESVKLKFLSFINSAQDWISIKDMDGKYIIVNPAVADAFHVPPGDFTGKTAYEILPREIAEIITSHDNEVIENLFPIHYDEVIPIEGQDRLFHAVRFPLADYKGNLEGICSIARDVTTEKRLKEQLIQSEKFASLGRLAAGVTHEINSPLSRILSNSENIRKNLPENGPNYDDIAVIIRETLRCKEIIRNLNEFARQEKPVLQPVHPDTIIAQSLLLIQKQPLFKDIDIIISAGEDIPQVEADIRQIIEVVLNLMINAAEAMHEKGRVVLSTQYDKANGHCIISVQDSGPGIPENLKDKLFEPFYSTKGTFGLGLAVSWSIVERHGGIITVASGDTGGALFRIILPVMAA